MNFDLSSQSWQILAVFGCYLVGAAILGILSHRLLSGGSFVKEYFLGNRGLGAWVLALTVAATAISGGSFMGFPSLIYSKGWVMALWIGSYMIVPIMSLVLMGKRLNQVARISGSVTVPDVLRDRFRSPSLGITASLLILLFLACNLVAQFKAGGLVMREAMRLPPADANFLDANLNDAEDQLVLRFSLAKGGEETVHTPLPTKTAEYLPDRTVVDRENGRVRLFFTIEGREEPLAKWVSFPPQSVRLPWMSTPVELGYLIGLFIFAVTVVAYTAYGGFWAVAWNDFFQGVVMFTGIILLTILAIQAVPAIGGQSGLPAATEHLRHLDPPDGERGNLVFAPGPSDYLPIGLAFSFFLMWSLMSPGQPSGMVRLMAFKDTTSLRRATMVVAVYFFFTYICLVVIFVCARAIYPTEYLLGVGSEGQPDSIMPAMARSLAHPVVAGVLLAAPFAAIMSTVSSFLLMISSSLVRDLYQRTLNPDVSDSTVKLLSYFVTTLVGAIVLVVSINPPEYLQYIIVFTGTGQGCSFLAPALLALYWRKATKEGILASMLGGFFAVFGLYVVGWTTNDSFAPYHLAGLSPVPWGMLASLVCGVGVSLLTKPDEALTSKYFP